MYLLKKPTNNKRIELRKEKETFAASQNLLSEAAILVLNLVKNTATPEVTPEVNPSARFGSGFICVSLRENLICFFIKFNICFQQTVPRGHSEVKLNQLI